MELREAQADAAERHRVALERRERPRLLVEQRDVHLRKRRHHRQPRGARAVRRPRRVVLVPARRGAQRVILEDDEREDVVLRQRRVDALEPLGLEDLEP